MLCNLEVLLLENSQRLNMNRSFISEPQYETPIGMNTALFILHRAWPSRFRHLGRLLFLDT